MLRLSLVSIFVLATFGLAEAADEKGPTEPTYLYRAKVLKVLNGDTVDMDIDLGFYVQMKAQRVRLLGIDAPEPSGETQAAGEAATAYLKNLIEGKTVIVRTIHDEDSPDRTTSFGRWSGQIYLEGTDISQEMIRSGHAKSDP
jgi:micrococcal nuclease